MKYYAYPDSTIFDEQGFFNTFATIQVELKLVSDDWK